MGCTLSKAASDVSEATTASYASNASKASASVPVVSSASPFEPAPSPKYMKCMLARLSLANLSTALLSIKLENSSQEIQEALAQLKESFLYFYGPAIREIADDSYLLASLCRIEKLVSLFFLKYRNHGEAEVNNEFAKENGVLENLQHIENFIQERVKVL